MTYFKVDIILFVWLITQVHDCVCLYASFSRSSHRNCTVLVCRNPAEKAGFHCKGRAAVTSKEAVGSKPIKTKMSRPTNEHDHSQEMPKAATEKSTQVYQGKGATSSSRTHLDHGKEEREYASSSYSRQNNDNGSDGKKFPRKMRTVTFHRKVFFENGEIEDLPEDSDEQAIRISSSDITEENDLPDTDTYQRFFRWEGKDSHESQSEIERTVRIAVDEDTKTEDERLVSGGAHQQIEVRLSGLNLLSNNSAPGSRSPPLKVAHDVQPLAVKAAGLNLGKVFCGLPYQLKRKSRGTLSPEITGMTQGIPDISEVARHSAFHGSNSCDFPAMGISCDLIKVNEDNPGPSRSSPKKLYNVILH